MDTYLTEAKDEAEFLRQDLVPNSMEYYLNITEIEEYVFI